MRIVVVGAGWSGAVAAHQLAAAGHRVDVYEADDVVGGHSRNERLCGTWYEANGPHVLHTNDATVAGFIQGIDLPGWLRPYRFEVLTEIDLGDDGTRYMSWPPQVAELEELYLWPTIKDELSRLPATPSRANFEAHVIDLMGPTCYRLFVEGYTAKQWGCEPSRLAATLAPRRVELRTDGYRGLFRDAWQWFAAEGAGPACEVLLRDCSVTTGAELTLADLEEERADAFVITAPLDALTLSWPLAWRGVALRSTYRPGEGPQTPAHVVNRPSAAVPYTRTIETAHASGERSGSVVSEEYPGAPARHYPVPTPDRQWERRNVEAATYVTERLGPGRAYFAGRLATYRYINQDQAIGEALTTARAVLSRDGT